MAKRLGYFHLKTKRNIRLFVNVWEDGFIEVWKEYSERKAGGWRTKQKAYPVTKEVKDEVRKRFGNDFEFLWC